MRFSLYLPPVDVTHDSLADLVDVDPLDYDALVAALRSLAFKGFHLCREGASKLVQAVLVCSEAFGS